MCKTLCRIGRFFLIVGLGYFVLPTMGCFFSIFNRKKRTNSAEISKNDHPEAEIRRSRRPRRPKKGNSYNPSESRKSINDSTGTKKLVEKNYTDTQKFLIGHEQFNNGPRHSRDEDNGFNKNENFSLNNHNIHNMPNSSIQFSPTVSIIDENPKKTNWPTIESKKSYHAKVTNDNYQGRDLHHEDESFKKQYDTTLHQVHSTGYSYLTKHHSINFHPSKKLNREPLPSDVIQNPSLTRSEQSKCTEKRHMLNTDRKIMNASKVYSQQSVSKLPNTNEGIRKSVGANLKRTVLETQVVQSTGKVQPKPLYSPLNLADSKNYRQGFETKLEITPQVVPDLTIENTSLTSSKKSYCAVSNNATGQGPYLKIDPGVQENPIEPQKLTFSSSNSESMKRENYSETPDNNTANQSSNYIKNDITTKTLDVETNTSSFEENEEHSSHFGNLSRIEENIQALNILETEDRVQTASKKNINDSPIENLESVTKEAIFERENIGFQDVVTLITGMKSDLYEDSGFVESIDIEKQDTSDVEHTSRQVFEDSSTEYNSENVMKIGNSAHTNSILLPDQTDNKSIIGKKDEIRLKKEARENNEAVNKSSYQIPIFDELPSKSTRKENDENHRKEQIKNYGEISNANPKNEEYQREQFRWDEELVDVFANKTNINSSSINSTIDGDNETLVTELKKNISSHDNQDPSLSSNRYSQIINNEKINKETIFMSLQLMNNEKLVDKLSTQINNNEIFFEYTQKQLLESSHRLPQSPQPFQNNSKAIEVNGQKWKMETESKQNDKPDSFNEIYDQSPESHQQVSEKSTRQNQNINRMIDQFNCTEKPVDYVQRESLNSYLPEQVEPVDAISGNSSIGDFSSSTRSQNKHHENKVDGISYKIPGQQFPYESECEESIGNHRQEVVRPNERPVHENSYQAVYSQQYSHRNNKHNSLEEQLRPNEKPFDILDNQLPDVDELSRKSTNERNSINHTELHYINNEMPVHRSSVQLPNSNYRFMNESTMKGRFENYMQEQIGNNLKPNLSRHPDMQQDEETYIESSNEEHNDNIIKKQLRSNQEPLDEVYSAALNIQQLPQLSQKLEKQFRHNNQTVDEIPHNLLKSGQVSNCNEHHMQDPVGLSGKPLHETSRQPSRFPRYSQSSCEERLETWNIEDDNDMSIHGTLSSIANTQLFSSRLMNAMSNVNYIKKEYYDDSVGENLNQLLSSGQFGSKSEIKESIENLLKEKIRCKSPHQSLNSMEHFQSSQESTEEKNETIKSQLLTNSEKQVDLNDYSEKQQVKLKPSTTSKADDDEERLKQIKTLRDEATRYRPYIQEYMRAPNHRKYHFIEESLLRIQIRLDKVDVDHSEELRPKRKEVIKYIYKLLRILDHCTPTK